MTLLSERWIANPPSENYKDIIHYNPDFQGYNLPKPCCFSLRSDVFDVIKWEYVLILEQIPLLSLFDLIWKVKYSPLTIFDHTILAFILISINQN